MTFSSSLVSAFLSAPCLTRKSRLLSASLPDLRFQRERLIPSRGHCEQFDSYSFLRPSALAF
jgi:hypothetical protein